MPKKSKNSKKRIAKIALRYWFVLVALVVLVEIASVRHFTGQTLSADTYRQYQPDASGNIRLESLGIVIRIGDTLKKQGLIAVEDSNYVHHGQPGINLTFTTSLLAKKYEACDGLNGGIGSLTRYSGLAATMPEHQHGTTAFDYPGFHIVYQAPMTSCVADSSGYSARDLADETVAARQLWDAVRTAKSL